MVTLFSFPKDKLFFMKKNYNYWLFKRNFLHYNKYHTKINYIDNPVKRPTLIINEGCVKNVLSGFPWLYSKDVKNPEDLILYSPCLVNIKDEYNENIGIGIYNKNSIISSRILSRNINDYINEEFFNDRIKKAYEKRLELYENDNYFRVVNAESDLLPGVIIDKYNKLICVQINASGMDILLNMILKSIETVLNPDTIILKNDSHIRKLEKLPLKKEVYKGLYKSPIEVRENGLTFFVDILKGQKTGWYYDQRCNRSMLISFCKNKNVLDLFSYVGSFGITLAYYGANEVTCVDSSYLAIKNGIKSAHYNNVLYKMNFVHSCVKSFLNICLNAQFLNNYNKDISKNKEEFLLFSTKENEEMKCNKNDHIPLDIREGKKKKKAINYEIENSEKTYVNDEKCRKKENIFSDIQNIFIYQMGKNNKYIEDIDDIEKLLIKNNNFDFFKKKYDVILIDPPPLARNNYLLPSALKIYQKLLYISFKLIQKPGYVFVSSCNKLIGYNELNLCIKRSLNWSKCNGIIIGEGRISSDHPIHVSLPESKYLTSILLMIT
ncbi:S-adenosylmethionine-dependent methyltransferase, putative [Plasmodium gallinaceum]|uniref:S-adenosylmethionine-dependent methyltransferase, putative n=1 Tax=Plasmodium gallinaceum TaxID=5849 RepID=A0A1J1GQ90_PLAGA|nr:S-adenosylmethionine-dependent methyltransferase, putative [Plasmodium gallinaceum]CRG94701.1 S-adenosylmethionine-dependent methyltransferase, putative [Plasmodium gallinaceum]